MSIEEYVVQATSFFKFKHCFNVFHQLSTIRIESFEFLLIFSILIQLYVDILTLIIIFVDFTFNHCLSLSFQIFSTNFPGLTSRTNYRPTCSNENNFVNVSCFAECYSFFVLQVWYEVLGAALGRLKTN